MKAETCCCCINLRIGCFIIGYLTLAYRVVLFGLKVHHIMIIVRFYDSLYYYLTFYVILITAILMLNFFYVIFTVILIIGLHKSKARLVVIFLISSCIVFGMDIIIANIIFFKYVTVYDTYQLFMSAIGFVIRCLHLYFYFIIRSYYIDMSRDRPENPEIG